MITNNRSCFLLLPPAGYTNHAETQGVWNMLELGPFAAAKASWTCWLPPSQLGPWVLQTRPETPMPRCCCAASASDGLILQPDKPATSIDASFTMALEPSGRKLQGHIWGTYAEVDVIPAQLPWHYVLSIDVKVPWQLQVDDFYPPLAMTGGARGWVARRWHAAHRPTACLDGQLAVKSGCLLGPSAVAEADLPRILNDRPVMVANDTHQFDLLQLSPVLENGWVLLGELGKYVSVSRKRFPRMTVTPERA